eukprot:5792313-Alexandrium_andersonii.AAC.1
MDEHAESIYAGLTERSEAKMRELSELHDAVILGLTERCETATERCETINAGLIERYEAKLRKLAERHDAMILEQTKHYITRISDLWRLVEQRARCKGLA